MPQSSDATVGTTGAKTPERVYRFTPTQDWFSHNIPTWKKLIEDVGRQTPSPRVLEIGSWEGRSAVFMLTELCNPTGSIVCIDHFDLLTTAAGKERYKKLHHNLRIAGADNYRVLPQFSFPALMSLLEEELEKTQPGFDWVYVDGSHEAVDTMLDGELSWRLARKGATVIFDDYHWDKEPEDSKHHPKRGIDTFLKLHEGEYECLSSPEDYQVILRKTAEMRIGFLVGGKKPNLLVNEALGYGINVAFTIDSSYCQPAAVAIHSLVERTPGRISIYIINCGGLTEEHETKLRGSLPRTNDVTVSFLPLPANSLANELGPSWAKLDLHCVLPVERVLYFDADILFRGDITPLWETDIGNRAIGAAPDVGHPMGHDQAHAALYFNAGVMLMNLKKIREMSDVMLGKSRQMQDSKLRDQDVLNAHFGDWAPLSLQWNAQGLGTYVRYPSADRERLNIAEMEEPLIVHFTGPVNPSLVDVLNPYIQPPTAKPWGFFGAPGHPFAEGWWKMLAKTPFASFATPKVRASRQREAVGRAIADAVKKFQERVNGVTDEALVNV
ncbi:glycosyltransferase family 8 protein [Macrolepiota fuliginosa MF-IS2]|uniref:Glycosyltransferase family 8 protein n=1 Tax=Macrolepiota fuliginosa MF-IS2 TaxID=1400762 RepID=A0A9P5X2Z6_9AGAR|nr:glycosyltransferase family 8 protein [Macrolepiota fuliginosa MF-IS2]